MRRAYERARRGIEAIMGGVLVCLGVRLGVFSLTPTSAYSM
jgi:hypothetical protein